LPLSVSVASSIPAPFADTLKVTDGPVEEVPV
jgi:hypothetical protein